MPVAVVTARNGIGTPPTVRVVSPILTVNSAWVSRMLATSRLAPSGARKTTSMNGAPPSLTSETSMLPPPAAGPPTFTSGLAPVATGSGASSTSNSTSLPEESLKPIFSLP